MFSHPSFATVKELAIDLNIATSSGSELITKLREKWRVIWIGKSNVDHALRFLEGVLSRKLLAYKPDVQQKAKDYSC